MGKRTKYTPEIVERICSALCYGASRLHAAALVGVDRHTLVRWEHAKPEFAEALEKAEAAGALHLLRNVEQASSMDWRAAAWMLEHRFPDMYGRRALDVRAQVSAPTGVQAIGVQFIDASTILAQITAGSQSAIDAPIEERWLVEAEESAHDARVPARTEPEPPPVERLPIVEAAAPVPVDPLRRPVPIVEPVEPTRPARDASEPELTTVEMILRSMHRERERRQWEP